MKGELINFWAYASRRATTVMRVWVRSGKFNSNSQAGEVGRVAPGKRIAVEFCYLTGRAWHTWFAFVFVDRE